MGIKGACPLATMSNVYIDVSNNNTNQIYELAPPPTANIVSLRGGQQNRIAVYDIRSHSTKGMFNIGVIHKSGQKASLSYPSILFANRYIIGTYRFRGAFGTPVLTSVCCPFCKILSNILI